MRCLALAGTSTWPCLSLDEAIESSCWNSCKVCRNNVSLFRVPCNNGWPFVLTAKSDLTVTLIRLYAWKRMFYATSNHHHHKRLRSQTPPPPHPQCTRTIFFLTKISTTGITTVAPGHVRDRCGLLLSGSGVFFLSPLAQSPSAWWEISYCEDEPLSRATLQCLSLLFYHNRRLLRCNYRCLPLIDWATGWKGNMDYHNSSTAQYCYLTLSIYLQW